MILFTDQNGAKLEVEREDDTFWMGVLRAPGSHSERVWVEMDKREAINLASKLLQWGTSS